MSRNLEIVRNIYAAFAKGDVAPLLEACADDVRWDEWADNASQRAGVPWMAPRQGKAGVMAWLQVFGQMKLHDFQVLALMEGGNQVASEIEIDAETPTGGRYRDQEIILWTFNDAGKLVRLRHYTDTAKHIAAAQHSAVPVAADY